MKNKYRIVLTETNLGDIIIDTDRDISVDELKNHANIMFKKYHDQINWEKTDYDIQAVYNLNCVKEEK